MQRARLFHHNGVNISGKFLLGDATIDVPPTMSGAVLILPLLLVSPSLMASRDTFQHVSNTNIKGGRITNATYAPVKEPGDLHQVDSAFGSATRFRHHIMESHPTDPVSARLMLMFPTPGFVAPSAGQRDRGRQYCIEIDRA